MKLGLYEYGREVGAVAGKGLEIYKGRSGAAAWETGMRDDAKPTAVKLRLFISYSHSESQTFFRWLDDAGTNLDRARNPSAFPWLEDILLEPYFTEKLDAPVETVGYLLDLVSKLFAVTSHNIQVFDHRCGGMLAFPHPQIKPSLNFMVEDHSGQLKIGYPWHILPKGLAFFADESPWRSLRTIARLKSGFEVPTQRRGFSLLALEAVSPSRRDQKVALRDLLDTAEAKAAVNDSLKQEADALSSLLREQPALGGTLLEMIARRERHERVRWLAIEELTKRPMQPEGFLSVLLEGLAKWDESTESLALLGAAVALNLLSVPTEYFAQIRTELQGRLGAVDPRQLDTMRTAMVCQFISTLGSYAEPGDLSLLSRFWGRGSGYSLRLAALDAAKRVVRCFPADSGTEEFFAREGQGLARQAASSLDLPETTEVGAIFHATICLLAARLGPEARALIAFARTDRSRSRQLARAFVSAARTLTQVGQDEWRKARQEETEAWRREIEALRVSREGREEEKAAGAAVRQD